MTDPHPTQLVAANVAARRLGFRRTLDLAKAFWARGLDVYETNGPRSRKVREVDVLAYLDSIRLATREVK